jgi:hypothetical protein
MDYSVNPVALFQAAFCLGICIGVMIAALIWWQFSVRGNK